MNLNFYLVYDFNAKEKIQKILRLVIFLLFNCAMFLTVTYSIVLHQRPCF